MERTAELTEHEGARAVLERLYAALAGADVGALRALVHADLEGTVSEGMPFGLGGSVRGARGLIDDVWGAVAAVYSVVPQPEEYLDVGGGRVVVLGHYVGRARTTGRPFRAAFAHDWTVADGKVTALTQVTDTWRWHDALEPAEA